MSEMDILFPVPDGRRNADDMGNPPDPTAAPAQGEPQTEYQAGWDNCYAMAEPAISALRDERDDWKRKYGDANEWGLRNTAAWKDRAERAEAEARESNERAHAETERRMRAEAECADLRRRLDEHIDDKERALRLSAKESTRLTTEVERLRADAERYRWLRDRMAHQQCGPNVGWTLDTLLPGDDPDAAIDAARAGK